MTDVEGGGKNVAPDPVLEPTALAVMAEFEAAVSAHEAVAAATLLAVTTVRVYGQRTMMNSEKKSTRNFQTACGLLGDLCLDAPVPTEQERRAAHDRNNLTGAMVAPSAMSKVLLEPGGLQVYAKTVPDAHTMVRGASRPPRSGVTTYQSEVPLHMVEEGLEGMRPLAELSQELAAGLLPDPVLLEQLAEAPARDFVSTCVGMIFLETVTAFADPQAPLATLDKEIASTISVIVRDDLNPTTREYEAVQCASKFIDFIRYSVETNSLSNPNIWQLLSTMMGIDNPWLAPGETELKNLAPYQQLLMNSYRVLVPLFNSRHINRQANDVLVLNSGRTIDTLQHYAESILPELQAENDAFYQRLSGLELDAEQISALEFQKRDRIMPLLETLLAAGVVGKADQTALAELVWPRLSVAFAEEQLAAANAVIAEARQKHIAAIEEAERPYRYTADAIRKRAFPDGPQAIRDIEATLEKKQLPVDRATAQSLAILVMQSQFLTKNPAAYFERLLQAQGVIETELQALSAVDPAVNYQSSLANAVHLLGELGEAEVEVEYGRLQRLITEYCYGPELTASEAAAKVAPEPLAGLEPTPAVEPAPVAEPEQAPDHDDVMRGLVEWQRLAQAKYAKRQTDRERAQEAYKGVLNDLLQNEHISFIDVVAARRGSERSHGQPGSPRERVGQDLPSYVNIDGNRLVGLLDLRNQLRAAGHSAEVHFIREMEGAPYPPFVLYLKRQAWSKGGVMILEDPVINHSSRLYVIDPQLGASLEDILLLKHSELKELGVVTDSRVHRPQGSPLFMHHYNHTLYDWATQHLVGGR